MDQRVEHESTVAIDSKSCEVLSRLQRPGISAPAFTQAQLRELSSNHGIKTHPRASGYKHITALNHIAKGKPGIGHKDGTKSLSLMIWDLLQTDELADDLLLLATATQLHQRTGAFKREARVSNPMGSWILENWSMLKDTVSFSTSAKELNEFGASSKRSISLTYRCCGAAEETTCTRFTEKVRSHQKYGTEVKCSECSKSYVPLSAVVEHYEEMLADSGISLEGITEDQFALPSGSSEEIEIFFGCHEDYVSLSVSSFREKLRRAAKLHQSQICCNDCSIAQGKIEGQLAYFLKGNIATMKMLGLPSAVLKNQFRFEDHKRKAYDFLLEAPNGELTLIEVDGGFHYENPDAAALKKKIEVDKVKTELALSRGYNLIRIDERRLITPTAEVERLLLKASIGDVERYTVIGEECPGAKLANVRELLSDSAAS